MSDAAHFCKEAQRLSQLLLEERSSCPHLVLQWRWKHALNPLYTLGGADGFLEAAVALPSRRPCLEDLAEDEMDAGDEELLQDLEEPGHLDDPGVTNRRASRAPEAAETVDSHLLRLHAVWHPTWRCPVLYFRFFEVVDTEAEGGERQLRQAALESMEASAALLPESSSLRQLSRSGFVGEEAHPALSVPYYFLHPCGSTERMQLLRGEVRHRDATDGEVGARARARESLGTYSPLLSWMSMVVPAMGLSELWRPALHAKYATLLARVERN
eukprot:scaffold343_cov245-Pinguiococcus_pyrenoidosus.AAC.37